MGASKWLLLPVCVYILPYVFWLAGLSEVASDS